MRAGAGLFRLEGRGLIRVTGGDRERWLNGMLSNDVAALAPGPEASGCYAAQLTRTGRIVADYHVLLRPDSFWLETLRTRVAPALESLDRFLIADDVVLADESGSWDRLGVEGPAAPAVLAAACEGGLPELAPESGVDARIGGVEGVVAAFGWSGEPARQVFVPAGSGAEVAAALAEAGRATTADWVEADPETLEILRIEAGIPLLGAELDEDVLPDEAHLDHAVSTTKGCYTGQEVVARMRSQGRPGHLLVALAFDAEPAAPGTHLTQGDRRVGEVTSSCLSPRRGAIGLGFVRRAQAEAGTALRAGDKSVDVQVLGPPSTPP